MIFFLSADLCLLPGKYHTLHIEWVLDKGRCRSESIYPGDSLAFCNV